MNKKYNVSVTFEDLHAILVSKFGFSSEKAKIATVALIYSQLQEQQSIQNHLKEETLLFLGGNSEKYQTHIFSTRYTICFSDAVLEILNESIIPIIMALVGMEDFTALSEILCGVKSILKNCRKIKDNECCVYYQVLAYLKKHNNKWFSAEQVMPDVGKERICVNLDKEWACKFRDGDTRENCSLTIDSVKRILEELDKDSVLKSTEDKSLYAFKI